MKSGKYKKFVRSLRCCHCGKTPCEPHHIIGIDSMGIMGSKAPDIAIMPLCGGIGGCHSEVHKFPHEWPQTRWMIETLDKAVEAGVIKI